MESGDGSGTVSVSAMVLTYWLGYNAVGYASEFVVVVVYVSAYMYS